MRKSDQKKLEKMRSQLASMRDRLDDMAGFYRDKFDNASERWKVSEAGNECDTARENLEIAAAEVESAESILAEYC